MSKFTKAAATLMLLMMFGNTTNMLWAQQDKTFTVKGVKFTMKYIRGSNFCKLGRQSVDPNKSDYRKDATPETRTHAVSLDSYYLGETEVTQALWNAVMNDRYNSDDIHVHGVSWESCQKFIQKLNQLTGKKFRLPTEAEWEWAAVGNDVARDYATATAYGKLDDYAWYWRNSGDKYLNGSWNWETTEANHCRPHPVKTKLPNDNLLYDMTGNVPEWCQDRYDYLNPAQYYTMLLERNKAGGVVHNPQGPDSFNGRDYRVARGGGWDWSEDNCKVWQRASFPADMGVDMMGFRLALSE